MSEVLEARDLSSIEVLSEEDDAWLDRLQRHLRTNEHVVRFGETEGEDDWVLYRDSFGGWQTGRYIGELAFERRRLRIRPRLGEDRIAQWLAGALNLLAVPDTSTQRDSDSFIALLMAAVWCRAVDVASRHGPPAFRRDHSHEGFYVRGRLDLRATAQLRGRGSPHVASVTRPRDLDNQVSRCLVAAERVLVQHIGHGGWRTPRVRQVMPQLVSAVGGRPVLPRQRSLQRVRYTPITLPFKRVADLSWRIARQRGFAATSEEGKAEGLLLDVAELWELFVLSCVRRAFPELKVEHGTASASRHFLLQSAHDSKRKMGRIKPDILVRDGDRVVAVLDAKYKRLKNYWPERPDGVDRGDLYQLASYLSRYHPHGNGVGALLYPDDPENPEQSTAEALGPWLSGSEGRVVFSRLSVEPQQTVQQLQGLWSSSEQF